MFSVISVGEVDCRTTLASQMQDFEDAWLAVCAKWEKADYIVSRDNCFISAEDSPVLVVPPGKLIELVEGM